MMMDGKVRELASTPHGWHFMKDGDPDAELRHHLHLGLSSLGLELAPDQRAQLIDYVALLARWNAVYNLSAVRDPMEIVALHVLDSLSIVDLVRDAGGRDILDVGTGAGLPGIPVAIALRDRSVRLIDAVAKKVSFLRHVKIALKLPNILPLNGRVEALTLTQNPSVIVSRAYAELGKMIASIDHLVDEATTVIAMKGIDPSGELAALPERWRLVELRMLDVPFIGAKRCAVVLTRRN